jgi:hypothetical protein
MMKNIILILLLFFSFNAFAQKSEDVRPAKKISLFDFLTQKEILEIKMESNFDSLCTHKNKIAKFIPGKAFLLNEPTEFEIGLKPRGKYRRKICDVPPLRIKFKKKSLKKMGIKSKFNSLKLVTHCFHENRDAKTYILKEYLAYQLYQLHSDISLRTQLVKITYYQTGKKKKIYSGYGFFIEDHDELDDRNDAKIVERMGVPYDSLMTLESNVHALFQCMVGNSDWSLFNFRNIKFLKMEGQDRMEIFPYDFDFSGFVNANYAIPNPDYDLETTQDRVFLGKIYDKATMREAANVLLEKREATINHCKNFKHLPKWQRKEVIKYLNSFYKILKKEDGLNEKLHKLSPKK